MNAITKTEAAAPAHKFKEPGIYLDMPEDDYFACGELGGTSVKECIHEASEWWWKSEFNPLKPELTPEKREKISNGKKFGRALHKGILEGLEAYEREYARDFDPSQFPNAIDKTDQLTELLEEYNAEHYDETALHTAAEIKAELKALGLKTSGNKDDITARLLEAIPDANIATFKPYSTSGTKDEIIERINDAGINVELMQTHRDSHAKTIGERILLKPEWDAAIRIMAQIAHQDPQVSAILKEGIPEVSVFWNDGGVPCRARFDWLRVRGTYDLKSFAGQQNKSVKQAITRAIENYFYHLQEAHYREARLAMKNLPIFGGTEEQREYIKKCQENDEPDFTFIFFKSLGAPILEVVTLPQSTLDIARQERAKAFENWLEYFNHYGLDKLWLRQSKTTNLDGSDFSPWFGIY